MKRSLEYEDASVLDILENGSTLAGEIEHSTVFESAYKPCLATVGQLEDCARRRDALIMSATKSSGSDELDRAVLKETREEIQLVWADGPWKLSELEAGATLSRRFPLEQGDKIRMVDDYSVSGVNDSCAIHTKLDLQVVDIFVAAVKSFSREMQGSSKSTSMVAKTYDLKSAYRQIPVRPDHLKFAYFCIYNCENDGVEICRSRTLPFGATQSVYSLLRLSRMLHCVACRGAKSSKDGLLERTLRSVCKIS